MSSTREVVASYPDYEGAQYAVDALSDRRFPVERLAIVGAGLQSFEQVTGRKGYGKAAAQGLVTGAVVGAALGWLLGLFTVVQPLVGAIVLAIWGVVIGGVIGMVLGLIGHALSGGRRDFSSVSTVRAQRYDVLAEADVAQEAKRALAEIDPATARSGNRTAG
ncbi:MAG: glycine zipper family protein [Actinomycetota bacterium]|nr:glycine zipper family protein [Actinomycetota bacterium]